MSEIGDLILGILAGLSFLCLGVCFVISIFRSDKLKEKEIYIRNEMFKEITKYLRNKNQRD